MFDVDRQVRLLTCALLRGLGPGCGPAGARALLKGQQDLDVDVQRSALLGLCAAEGAVTCGARRLCAEGDAEALVAAAVQCELAHKALRGKAKKRVARKR